MTSKNTSKPKSFLKKHWSNILFFTLLLIFIIPTTRVYVQSWIMVPLLGSPKIFEDSETQKSIDYDFELKLLNGETKNLNQSKGKPVIINFWATWCTPCIAEMPGLVDLHAEYGQKVDFYFISNETQEKLNLFLKKKGYKIPVYNPVSNVPKNFDTSSIPSTYLIDANGNIIAHAQGMADWDSNAVKKLIDKLLNGT